MSDKRDECKHLLIRAVCAAALFAASATMVHAQAPGPTVLDGNLAVRTVASGLAQPISMAFIGASDLFVLEKASGKRAARAPTPPCLPKFRCSAIASIGSCGTERG